MSSDRADREYEMGDRRLLKADVPVRVRCFPSCPAKGADPHTSGVTYDKGDRGKGVRVRFADEVEWRVSRRGLVIAVPGGDSVLLDHPHAADLPGLLAEDPS